MTNRAACMGVALIVTLICGSIKDTMIVFAGASVITVCLWAVIERFVPHG
jgi:hypothetical protein